jgi:hypothetical protein
MLGFKNMLTRRLFSLELTVLLEKSMLNIDGEQAGEKLRQGEKLHLSERLSSPETTQLALRSLGPCLITTIDSNGTDGL